jgi:hypothetical protein
MEVVCILSPLSFISSVAAAGQNRVMPERHRRLANNPLAILSLPMLVLIRYSCPSQGRIRDRAETART